MIQREDTARCSLPPRAAIYVRTDVLQRNYRRVAALAREKGGRQVRLFAVVKANAYGHDARLAVPAFLAAGCLDFAVATPEEGFAVRETAPRANILVLGYSPPAIAAEMAAANLTQTVFSAAYADDLARAARRAGVRLAVHLKIDTGMHRLGFSPEDVDKIYVAARREGLFPTGIFTHFPAPREKEETAAARAAFTRCRAALSAKGLALFSHAAASGALLSQESIPEDGVRSGILLYGYTPGGKPFAPALTLTAPLIQCRRLFAGERAGYGGAFRAEGATTVGILPLGYADGLPRALAGLPVTVRHEDRAYPAALAAICMDQCLVDLGDAPAAAGDTVTLWQNAALPAKRLGTIPYEVLAALSPRVPRIAVKEKE